MELATLALTIQMVTESHLTTTIIVHSSRIQTRQILTPMAWVTAAIQMMMLTVLKMVWIIVLYSQISIRLTRIQMALAMRVTTMMMATPSRMARIIAH